MTAADRATGSAVGAPAREPAERYDRRQAAPRTENLYAVAHERAYNGLPAVGGDAVVLSDGTVHSLGPTQQAARLPRRAHRS